MQGIDVTVKRLSNVSKEGVTGCGWEILFYHKFKIVKMLMLSSVSLFLCPNCIASYEAGRLHILTSNSCIYLYTCFCEMFLCFAKCLVF